MDSLTASDILTFLEGNASPEMLQQLQAWAESKPKRARKLARFQKIYDEFSHLREYKTLDGEYEDFQKLLASSVAKKVEVDTASAEVSELDLLHYISGHKGPRLTAAITEWSARSTDNAKTLAELQVISDESEYIKRYRKFDPRLEYDNLKKIIARSQEKVIAVPVENAQSEVVNPKNESNRSALWPILLGLALLLLLATGGWYLWNKANSNKSLFAATQEEVQEVETSDGSQITLGENSKLEYYSNAEKLDERVVKLSGIGNFNIASFKEKLFKAHVEDQIVVSTQESNFSIDEVSPYSLVIRNANGTLLAYSTLDSSVNVNINEGETYGFDGERFIQIVDEVEVPEGKEYQVLYVIDHLMENSNWRVTTAPYKAIKKSDQVSVNLDQPYELILEELVRSSDFAYEEMECEGCYRITRFAAK